MFDPAAAKRTKDQKAAIRKVLREVNEWVIAAIPIQAREGKNIFL